ncbi:MAG: flagellar M-ring protein FliF [Gracilibacteraceae bacterium]|jgi:flagellar M-ring protein FliF|nr:flagellar M-ring protein FliF [Gracilibacteraceae bacterium]
MGEFISKLRNNISEFWNGLEKGQKLRLIIAALLSFLLITSFIIYTSRPQMGILYSDLGQADAGTIIARLKEMNVNARIEGTTIYVPVDQIDELRAQLAVEGIFGDDSYYPEESKATFYETSADKNQRYLIAKQNKLKKGLSAIKGVEYADVNLYIPEDQTFIIDQNSSEATASLIIKMKSGYPALDRNQVNGIVQYISRSVKGLKPENVSIIDENGRSLVPDTGPNGTISSQMEMQEAVQDKIEQSITKFLEAPFGMNNVKVKAAVKLNFDSVTQSITTYEAPNAEQNEGIVRNMQDIRKEWIDASQGGVPGTDSNTDIYQYAELDSSKAQYNEASTVVNYEINEIKEQIVKEMGSIESLSVSVLINTLDSEGNPKEIPQELQDGVRGLVKYALQGFNYEAPKEENEGIEVVFAPFDMELTNRIRADQEAAKRAVFWERVIMIGTGVAAVLVFGAALFIMLKRRAGGYDAQGYAKETSEVEMVTSTLSGETLGDIELEDKNEVKKKIEKFVGLKPETVAQLLKTWLNED